MHRWGGGSMIALDTVCLGDTVASAGRIGQVVHVEVYRKGAVAHVRWSDGEESRQPTNSLCVVRTRRQPLLTRCATAALRYLAGQDTPADRGFLRRVVHVTPDRRATALALLRAIEAAQGPYAPDAVRLRGPIESV